MDRTGRTLQRTGQTERAVAVMLEQMERHALCRLGTDTGEQSERSDKPIEARTLVLGEVGLAGEVRGVSQVEQRLAEAAQLGFRRCVLPESNARRLHDSPLELRPAATVGAAMEALMP